MLGIYWELQTKFGNLMGFCWVFLNMPKFPMLGIFPLYPGLELLGNFKTKLGICWDFIGYLLGIHWESEKIPIWESGIFSCDTMYAMYTHTY